MRFAYSFINILALVSIGSAAAAPEASNSPKKAKYKADFDDDIKGSIKFKSNSEGQVKVTVKLAGLPKDGPPLLYHIHEKPVPSDGNCDATLGHFNPYHGNEDACDDAHKEVGDLSGKHGKIESHKKFFKDSYIEPYISLNETDPAFIGGHSIVIHCPDETRIACANITEN